jgi:hypothetical protein
MCALSWLSVAYSTRLALLDQVLVFAQGTPGGLMQGHTRASAYSGGRCHVAGVWPLMGRIIWHRLQRVYTHDERARLSDWPDMNWTSGQRE